MLIDQRVFQQHPENVDLLNIIRLGYEDRHIVLTTPTYAPGASPAVDTWIAQWPTKVQRIIDHALRRAPILAANRRRRTRRVAVCSEASSNLKANPPKLSVTAAVSLLTHPLRVLVENARNDGAFIDKMLLPAERVPYRKHIAERWIEIENGGGLGELTQRLSTSPPDTCLWMRTLVVVDSDARTPGIPSQQSTLVSAACSSSSTQWRIPLIQLSRRSIENYIPVGALFRWAAQASGHVHTARKRAAEQYKALSADQRYHYNLKSGLLGDVEFARSKKYAKNRTVVDQLDRHPLYLGLSTAACKALHAGFGPSVASVFTSAAGVDEQTFEQWLQSEVSSVERADLGQLILDEA